MNALLLLLAVTTTLVLQSGDRIPVEGQPVQKDGVVMFRSGGVLYSLPATEVQQIESVTPEQVSVKPAAEKKDTPRRKPVSEEERNRLLAELEKNHGGTPPPPDQAPPRLDPPPSREEVKETRREESQWRREARFHEEAVRRAQEDLALLEARIDDYRGKIQSLISLGYKPHQFTYDTTQLQQAIEQVPFAQLEVTRAIRANEQFREDARREGVTPGWLR